MSGAGATRLATSRAVGRRTGPGGPVVPAGKAVGTTEDWSPRLWPTGFMNASRQLAAPPTREAAGFTGRLPLPPGAAGAEASHPAGAEMKETRPMTGRV